MVNQVIETSHPPLFSRSVPLCLCGYSFFDLSPFFSHSCALFCTTRKFNTFLFNRFRTLCKKPPGVGVGGQQR